MLSHENHMLTSKLSDPLFIIIVKVNDFSDLFLKLERPILNSLHFKSLKNGLGELS